MKRPTKAAKAPGKGKTKPAKVRPRGGASGAIPPASHDAIRKAYDAALADGAAFADAKRAVEQFQTSRSGLDAARVELAELEAGVDIAADIAAKHFPHPERKRVVDAKAEDRFQLSQALEDLGWWLAEVPAGSRKARWRGILKGQINIQDRYSFESRSAHRYLLPPATAAKWIKNIAAGLKSNPDDAGRISSILAILENKLEAVHSFLERFYQRINGNRSEVLPRRQKTAEALAHRREPPRLVGKTKEQERKNLENDLSWIRTKKRTP